MAILKEYKTMIRLTILALWCGLIISEAALARRPLGFETFREVRQRSREMRENFHSRLEEFKRNNRHGELGFRSREEFEEFINKDRRIKEIEEEMQGGNNTRRAERDRLLRENMENYNRVMTRGELAYYDQSGQLRGNLGDRPGETLERILSRDAETRRQYEDLLTRLNQEAQFARADLTMLHAASEALPGTPQSNREALSNLERAASLREFAEGTNANKDVINAVGEMMGGLRQGRIDGREVTPLNDTARDSRGRTEKENFLSAVEAILLLGGGREHVRELRDALTDTPEKRSKALSGWANLYEKYMEGIREEAKEALRQELGAQEFERGRWGDKSVFEILARLRERSPERARELLRRAIGEEGHEKLLDLMKRKLPAKRDRLTLACSKKHNCLSNKVKFGSSGMPSGRNLGTGLCAFAVAAGTVAGGFALSEVLSFWEEEAREDQQGTAKESPPPTKKEEGVHKGIEKYQK